MLLLIGGAARTGKGILSRRLLLTLHQPYLSLDVVKMGLVNGLPSFGLDPEASAQVIAEQLWPLVRAMAVNMLETDVHYITCAFANVCPARTGEPRKQTTVWQQGEMLWEMNTEEPATVREVTPPLTKSPPAMVKPQMTLDDYL